MDSMPDWAAWMLGALLLALFAWYFWHTGATLFQTARQVISTIQNWPQTRRAMVEAEVRSGGRYPLWFRAVRVLLILAMAGLAILLIWRKLAAM